MPDHVKFCHLSDTHLGCFQYHLQQRAVDFGAAFENAFRLIAEEKPDFVIHTGDLFDRSLPTPLAIRQFRQACKKYLVSQKIPLILLAGNHDTAKSARGARPDFIARWQKSSTHHLLAAQGLAIFLNDSACVLRNESGEAIATFLGLRFYGKSTAPRLQELLTREHAILETWGEDIPRIALLHLLVKGVPLPVFDARPEAMDPTGVFHYIGVGHWHQRLDLPEYNIYCPGATEHTSPMDWNHAPGFFSVTMHREEGWLPHVEYRLLPGIRAKETVEICFPEENVPSEAGIKEIMHGHNRPGGIVRYLIRGVPPPCLANPQKTYKDCNNLLLKYYFVFKHSVHDVGFHKIGTPVSLFQEPLKKSLQAKLDEFY